MMFVRVLLQSGFIRTEGGLPLELWCSTSSLRGKWCLFLFMNGLMEEVGLCYCSWGCFRNLNFKLENSNLDRTKSHCTSELGAPPSK